LVLSPDARTAFLYRAEGDETWSPAGPQTTAVGDGVVEIALPLSLLGLTLGQEIGMFVVLGQDGREVERLPAQGVHFIQLAAYGP
jgi:hypothetical protein